jgi:hypothetical protein
MIKKLAAELESLRYQNQQLRELALNLDDRFQRGDAKERMYLENETLIYERIEQLNDLVVLLDQQTTETSVH